MGLSSKLWSSWGGNGADGNSAMMSSISEAWEIMNKHMGMKYDDIGKVFQKWSSEGELVCLLSPHLQSFTNECRKIPS
jgi:6-phosphogluconate dehydrogenase